MTSPSAFYHLALRDLLAAAGAQFVAASGWSVPSNYGDVVKEYEAIRGSAAMFDRSHHSRFLVTGTDALDVLRAVFAGHLEDLEEGRAMRTVSLAEDGSISDLVLVTRTGGIAYLVLGSPGQRLVTRERLQSAVAADFQAEVQDRTESTCLIAIAGPGAANLVAEHLAEALPARLQSLQSVTFQFHGFRGLAIRTSDSGEDGFEFMLAPAVAQHLIETLRPVVPLAGLQATEIARVEAAVPAFEPDLAPGLSPAEADLDALLGVAGGSEGRILAALLLEGDPVPAGTSVYSAEERVGEVRSCVRSPRLNATIALGIIDVREAFPGRQLTADGIPATVVAKPFYRRRT